MVKDIISSEPDRKNLKEMLESMKGKLGIDAAGHKFIMGVDLTRMIERLDKLDGGDNED